MTQVPETGDPGPMADVREGMTVIDKSGTDLGSVAELTMGDPGAATSAGQQMSDQPDLIEQFARSLGPDDDMPEQIAERLRRIGYLKATKTMSPVDIYVAGDQIARVEDDTVYLNVDRDELFAT